jgi:hypothetical protein
MTVWQILQLTLVACAGLPIVYYFGCGIYGYYKLREYDPVFPNRPFPITWLKNKAEPVFVLPQYNFKFELKRGTKRNGLYGVIGVSLTGVGPFRDGTDMVKLNKNAEKLAEYLRTLGYEVKDDYGTLKDLKDAVSKIDTLEYLDTPESQK